MSKKFMMCLHDDKYDELLLIAKDSGISIQELIRAVIIPSFLDSIVEEKRIENKRFNK